ncbi:MAG TPA: hypothetical protein VGL73_03505 [Caulobacteraceae bacterium]|jgi:hypothetical protein
MAFWSFANRSDTVRPVAAQPVATVDPKTYDADMRRAYDHGRLDERSRRRGRFGPLGFILVLVAAVGVILVVFAIREGSFSAGGAVVDNKLVQATSGVAPAIDNAASKTGTALETAGQNLKDQGAAIAGSSTPASSAP